MNNLFIRVAAFLLHIVLNAVIVAYVTNYDISGSWLSFIGFLLLALLLLFLFIRHLISFIQFIKTKT
jgi:LPXTG-motif cell wall-anchored protein